VSSTEQTKAGNLIIEGNLITGGLQMITGAGADKVLTTDASGVASWQTPAGGSLWTQTDSDIYYTDGNVGIGTAEPSEKLTVVGGNIRVQGEELLSEGFEGETFPPTNWTTGGNANWYRDTTTKYQGAASAGSGTISNSQSTWMDINYTFSEAGVVSFYWKVSSEANYDFLVFCLDNDSCTIGSGYTSRISGDVDWTQVIVSVSAGSHSFRWLYGTDGAVSEGSDKGWVDCDKLEVTRNIIISGTGDGIKFPDGSIQTKAALSVPYKITTWCKTSGTHNGNLGGLSGANTICESECGPGFEYTLLTAPEANTNGLYLHTGNILYEHAAPYLWYVGYSNCGLNQTWLVGKTTSGYTCNNWTDGTTNYYGWVYNDATHCEYYPASHNETCDKKFRLTCYKEEGEI